MTNVAQGAGTAVAAPHRIELVHSEPEARVAAQLLADIWPTHDGHLPVVPELVWVFAHTGNYVSVARADNEVIGTAIGFRAYDARGSYLHSHIAGVQPRWQGTNVGFALKQHQRSWALDNGIDRITWTFDPLVSRNAYFNVTKLGARLTGYYVNFYGPMNDGINSGDETDRAVATWDLTDERVVAAADGLNSQPDIDALRAAGVPVTLYAGPGGAPYVNEVDGDRLLLQLPPDIVALRRTDELLARSWREVLRETLVSGFADGYEVTGVTRDSWYLLAR
jgi:predicted GNAT superfamily acetyltransferase